MYFLSIRFNYEVSIATDHYSEQILETNRKSKHTRKPTLRTNLPFTHLEQKNPQLEQKRPVPHLEQNIKNIEQFWQTLPFKTTGFMIFYVCYSPGTMSNFAPRLTLFWAQDTDPLLMNLLM